MNGQWIGSYTGTSDGVMILNIDDRGSYYQGVAYLKDNDEKIPSTGVAFQTVSKDSEFQLRTHNLWLIHPHTGDAASWEQIKDLYSKDVGFANHVDVVGRWEGHSLKLSWTTGLGATGTCDLPRSRADHPSELKATQMKWSEFKLYVAELADNRHLFRGQRELWRLRTAFHRTGRANLRNFVAEDIQILHRHLSVRTRHIFNLSIPDENGAFLNLVQHHGYPTPLLDWTYSPYVATFFAYREISKAKAAKADPDERVRIFILDQRWRTDLNQVLIVDRGFPHFSAAEFISIENERMVPQQSISTVTNVDDIEAYIQKTELKFGRSYLTAIDLPVCERNMVFSELGYMGVTAGSLFPGFDGACEELKERNFR